MLVSLTGFDIPKLNGAPHRAPFFYLRLARIVGVGIWVRVGLVGLGVRIVRVIRLARPWILLCHLTFTPVADATLFNPR